MCFENRKLPAACVGTLSCITLLLAVVMIGLSFKFANSGFSTDLGEMGDYANNAFYVLIGAASIALAAAICGILAACIRNRCVAVCFGCTLFPAAIVILVTGAVILSVSNTPEEDLREFCFDNKEDFDAANADDNSGGFSKELKIKLRDTVRDVDYTVGGLVSKTMCSYVCPCDFDNINIDAK